MAERRNLRGDGAREMTTAFSTVATQIRAAREATIDGLGCQVHIEAAIRQERQPGEGYQRKGRITLGPYQCYVYYSGGGQAQERGLTRGDDSLTRQDRDTTWGGSFKLADGDEVWPTGTADAMSTYELLHPVYGRLRIERVQQMSIQGVNVGWQVGLTRVS
jgi:hypothetical protein